jgi:hypothetical protein
MYIEATKSEGGDWTNIPDGSLIAAKFVNFEETVIKWTDKNTGEAKESERYTWHFEVTEPGPFQGRRLRGQTSRNFSVHENCKAWNWMNSLIGREIPEGEKVNPETLYGVAARVVTEQSQPDSQNRVWDNVVDVLPAPSQHTAANVFG